MKKLIIFFLLLTSFFAKGQGTNVFKYLELKNVDTVGLTRVGQFWYNPTVGKFTFHDASGYKHFSVSGGGITNTAANNELMKSNGTNAVPSGMFSSTLGNLDLGSASLTGNRSIAAINTAATAYLVLTGQSGVRLGVGTNLFDTDGSNIALAGVATGISGQGLYIQGGGTAVTLASSNVGGSSSANIVIGTGNATVTTWNSGHILLDNGTVAGGGGKVGSIGIFTGTGSFGGGEKVIFIGNAVTNPTTNPTGGGIMFVKSADNKPYWRTPAGVETLMLTGGGVTFPLTSSQLTINNPAATFKYTFTAAAIAADRILNLPLTTATATLATTQDITDASLGPFSTIAPGYTNLSGNANSILKGNNTWIAPGTNGYVLTLTAGVPGWAAASGGGMTNPMTTLGDFIYEDASPAPARLAGNITTTKKFIAQTGNGSISAVPAWSTIVVGDIPLLSGFSNGTTPVSTDKIIGVQSGANVYWNLSQFAGYNLITAAGSSLTQRQTIDVYNGITAADNVTKTDLVLGGPLTVNTTISGPFKLILNNNLAGALTLNGTWTAAGVTENHVDIIPTITARATASDVIRAVNIAPSLTSAAATQTLTALLVNPTFTDANSATKYLLRIQNNATDAFTVLHNGRLNFQASYNSDAGSVINVTQNIGGTVTYLASSDAAYVSLIAPTYNVNSQGGTKAYGYFYNPVITNGTLATHYAFYAQSGDLLLNTGSQTIAAGQLTVTNGQTQAATFTGKVLVTGNFTTGAASNNILSIQNTNTAFYSTLSFDNTANNAIYYSGSTWNPSGTLLPASAMWVTVTGGGGIIFRSDGNGDIVTAIGGVATTKEVMRLKAGGAAIHTQQINTSGSPVAFKLVGGANTTLTASAESSDFYLNLARTVQFSTGALSLQRAAKIEGPTYGFVGASTLTDAATFSVINPPFGGTNATITNSHGILISSASLTNATNSYGLTVNTSTGATNNYAIQTIGGTSLFAAGTTSYAPFKLQSGSLLTTAQAFAVEANANSFYQTKNSTLRYGQGGVIFDNIADANNGTTVETDLYSYTTPANTLAEDGDKVVCSYIGTFNDVTATGQLKVYFGGTAIGNTGALTVSATGGWVAQVLIIRTGSTTARAAVNISTPGASTALYTAETDLTGLTLSGTNILKITGQAGGASGGSNDITGKFSMGYFFPAAHN